MAQKLQHDWHHQWNVFHDTSLFLFLEWIHPIQLDDFRNKSVLDAGCGGGQHVGFIAPYAKRVVGVDLNTADLARRHNAAHQNVEIITADIAEMDLGEQFDVVYCLGVVQHTDNPDKTVANLIRHLKPGGKLLLWVYAYEGSFLIRTILEPLKKMFLLRLSKPALRKLAWMLTALLYFPIYTVYRLPLRFLPFYHYFINWRKLSFGRNLINVFDKLNAPQTVFFRRRDVERWMDPATFRDIHISHYQRVSWRASGTKV